MSDKHAVKLKVIFSDSSEEDYDIFLAAVADGLVVAGKDDDGTILYTAGEGFSSWGVACISATPEVAVALIQVLQSVVHGMIDSLPLEIAPQFLEAMLTLSSGKKTQLYHESRAARLRGED